MQVLKVENEQIQDSSTTWMDRDTDLGAGNDSIDIPKLHHFLNDILFAQVQQNEENGTG